MKSFRALILYDRIGSAQWHRARALQRYCPADSEVSIAIGVPSGSFDIVLIPLDMVNQFGSMLKSQGSRILVYWGRGDFKDVEKLGYRMVTPGHIGNLGTLDSQVTVISNGVDLDTFWTPSYARVPKVLWGAPECSAWARGQEFMDPLRKALKVRKITLETRLVSSSRRYSPEEMREWYCSGAVYLELGNPGRHATQAFEAAACGCGIVGTGLGNVATLLQDHPECLVQSEDIRSLVEAVVFCFENQVGKSLAQNIRPWGWHVKVQDYYTLFRSLV